MSKEVKSQKKPKARDGYRELDIKVTENFVERLEKKIAEQLGAKIEKYEIVEYHVPESVWNEMELMPRIYNEKTKQWEPMKEFPKKIRDDLTVFDPEQQKWVEAKWD